MELIITNAADAQRLWGNAGVVRHLFGVGKPWLLKLVAEGKVKRKKMDPTRPKSTTVYCLGDVKAELESGDQEKAR